MPREKRREYWNRYATKNKKKLNAYNKKRAKGKRDYINDHKDRPCKDCGQSYPPYCMDLDHRDPSTKKFKPSNLTKHSWQKLYDELEKCDVVCAICHRIRTYTQGHHLHRNE